MERKFYTFLIFPGVHGRLRKIQLPFYAMHLMLGLSLVGLVTLGALANSYARMLLKVSNYNNVRDEREALKTQYRTLETVVSQTNAKLYSLQSLAAEVALTYGFGRARRPQFPHAMLSLATQSDSTHISPEPYGVEDSRVFISTSLFQCREESIRRRKVGALLWQSRESRIWRSTEWSPCASTSGGVSAALMKSRRDERK